MKTIVVEEWVQIPEGGKCQLTWLMLSASYCYCKDKIGYCDWPKGEDYKELQTHAS